MKKTIDRIARDILGLETLETRKWDSLDFHDLAVWSIKEALEAAYAAGGRQPKLRKALRNLIKASDDLARAIELAAVDFDTGLLDVIQPAQDRMIDATRAAEKVLKRGPP
jgi:hypothetical protein